MKPTNNGQRGGYLKHTNADAKVIAATAAAAVTTTVLSSALSTTRTLIKEQDCGQIVGFCPSSTAVPLVALRKTRPEARNNPHLITVEQYSRHSSMRRLLLQSTWCDLPRAKRPVYYVE